MKQLSSLFLCVVLAIVSNAQQKSITGKVADADTGADLSGASIRLYEKGSTKLVDYSGITDTDGIFVLKDLNANTYKLTISFVGYKSEIVQLHLSADTSMNITLEKEVFPIYEAVVTSLRHEKKVKDVPLPIEVVSEEMIKDLAVVTISDIVQNEPGVSISRDGIWATSLNIRGLSEQRIITMVDGNRIETATDLAAGISMIDPDDIERVEIIKGGASSLYGTGGLGGVVNFKTKEADFANKFYLNGEGSEYYASVNQMFNRRLAIEAGNERWNVRVSGFLRDAENTQTPEGVLLNSQFHDQNLSLALGFIPFRNHTLKLKYQNYTAKDAGIPGGAPFPGPAEATYLKANREMYNINYTIEFDKKLDNIQLNYFHQYIIRDVELVPNTPSVVRPPQRITAQSLYPSGYHTTDGIQFQSTWEFNDDHQLIAGVDAWQRQLETEREKNILIEVLDTLGNVQITNNMVKGEKPVPDSKFQSAGIFLQDELELFDDKLKILIGGRFDYIKIWNERAIDPVYTILNGIRNDTPPNQRITFEEGTEYNQSWSVNAGGVYQLDTDIDVAFNFSRSFRSPSLEERFKYIDLGSSVRIGNPALKPEKGYNFDLSYRVWKQNFVLRAGIFANFLSDMIVEEPGEFVYELNTGLNTGLIDTLPALINTNIDEARLYGFEFSFDYQFVPGWVLIGNGTYTRGENTFTKTDLPMIPPLNGRLGLRYTNPKIVSAELIIRGAADQDKVAIGEQQTAGYAVYDFFIKSREFDLRFVQLYFSGGIENIGDRAYTNHLATNRGGITVEPGRNIFIKMRLTF